MYNYAHYADLHKALFVRIVDFENYTGSNKNGITSWNMDRNI